MNILSVDLGRFSVKFHYFSVNRGKVYVKDTFERSFDEFFMYHQELKNEELDELEIQIKIIQEYFEEEKLIDKIYFILSNEYFTTRIFHLPVKSRKKAEMMIPFQLDEDLPFPINDSHYSYHLTTTNLGTNVLASVLQKNSFETLYHLMSAENILPNVITTEESVLQSYVQLNQLNESFCFLNLGHLLTTGYFFDNGMITAVQNSYTAGKSFDEVISETYQISTQEAIVFKHQNAFFLTEDQYDQVDEDQLVFAQMMRQIISPLIAEFKRWVVAHRISTGKSIDRVYLMGGTSSIKNIDNFLTEALEIPCEFIDFEELIESTNTESDKRFQYRQLTNKILSHVASSKMPLLNLRRGQYTDKSQNIFPMNSLAFNLSRVLIICLVISIFLGVDTLVTSHNLKTVEQRLAPVLKNPALGITNRERISYRRDAAPILKKLERKSKQLDQEYEKIESLTSVNALNLLNELYGQMNIDKDINLDQYTNELGKARFIFTAKTFDLLKAFEQKIKNSSFSNGEVDLDDKRKTLTVSMDI